MAWFDGYEGKEYDVNDSTIFARVGGKKGGAPVLLLHGFPQSHAMWHRVAQQIGNDYQLVMADLRGYGDSAKPPGDIRPGHEHSNYSKRVMAADLAALMTRLGHERFAVFGHDRGGRVAHRLALDNPTRVTQLGVIDIAPTLDMYEATDMRFASLYYHWFHLIQPAPLPERMIGGDALFYLRTKLGRWGAGSAVNEPEALADYERCFCNAAAIHAACEDYRASFGIDLDHDRASRAAGEKVACDMFVLWGDKGVVGRLFDPLTLWQAQCAKRVTGEKVSAGHYIPEELPEDTARILRGFLRT